MKKMGSIKFIKPSDDFADWIKSHSGERFPHHPLYDYSILRKC